MGGVGDFVSDAWDDTTDFVSDEWDRWGKDLTGNFFTGGLYSVGKEGYETYKEYKAAQEAAQKAQEEFQAQQQSGLLAQRERLEEQRQLTRATMAKSRRQAFAIASVMGVGGSVGGSSLLNNMSEDSDGDNMSNRLPNKIPSLEG